MLWQRTLTTRRTRLIYGLTGGNFYRTLMETALVGSAAFGVAFCFLAPFKFRYGLMLAYLALCLSWPYFAILLVGLPWSSPLFLIRHRLDETVALAALLAATIYSAMRWSYMRKPGTA